MNKAVVATVLGVFLVAFLSTGFAQEEKPQLDKEKLKKELLAEIEKKLESWKKEILKEIEKIIDEELAKLEIPEETPKEPVKPEKPPEPPAEKEPGFLGIYAEETDEGVAINEVLDGSPADEAGLKAGDVILKIDDTKIETTDGLLDVLAEKGAGTEVNITVLRDNKEQTIKVKLGKREKRTNHNPANDDDKDKDTRKKIREYMQKSKQKAKTTPERQRQEEENQLDLDSIFEQIEDVLNADPSFREELEKTLEQIGLSLNDFFDEEDGRLVLKEELKDTLRMIVPLVEGLLKELKKAWKQLDKLFEKLFAPEKKPEKPKVAPEKKPKKPKTTPKKPEKPAKPEKPYIGVDLDELTDEERTEFDIEEEVGLKIGKVVEDSPAEKAELKVGDIILKIDGKKVRGFKFLDEFIKNAKPGQEVTITILRDGKKIEKKLTLGKR